MSEAMAEGPPMVTLASVSASRAAVLAGAGVDFDKVSPGVDEAAVKALPNSRKIYVQAPATSPTPWPSSRR